MKVTPIFLSNVARVDMEDEGVTIDALELAERLDGGEVEAADGEAKITTLRQAAKMIADLYARIVEAERAGRDFQVARDAFDRAQADAGRLRAALERIEWINDICPWCYSDIERGHLSDCVRQAALSAEAGEGVKG